MEKRYKRMKVFDCQDMPDDVRTEFFDKCGSPSFGGNNDCYVEYYCYSEYKCVSGTGEHQGLNYNKEPIPYAIYNGNEILAEKMSDKRRLILERGDHIVSDWLLDNGAKLWEEVIIKHWW